MERRFVQIKNCKESYYAVDDWLDQHDYDALAEAALTLHGFEKPEGYPTTQFRRLNWNQMNYETMSIMTMYVEFYDPALEAIFLLTMADHVEKVVDPYAQFQSNDLEHSE